MTNLDLPAGRKDFSDDNVSAVAEEHIVATKNTSSTTRAKGIPTDVFLSSFFFATREKAAVDSTILFERILKVVRHSMIAQVATYLYNVGTVHSE